MTMHVHIINKAVIGGAEGIAAKLSHRFSRGVLYSVFPNDKTREYFCDKNRVELKNYLKLGKNILSDDKLLFTHNLQAHIVLSILRILVLILGRKIKLHWVIHFDAENIPKFWAGALWCALQLSRPKLIFVSQFALDKFKRHISKQADFGIVIHNGIDDKFFAYDGPTSLPPTAGVVSIGFIGRHAPVKRLELFLQICETLRMKHRLSLNLIIQSDIDAISLKNLLQVHMPSVGYDDVTLLSQESDQMTFYSKVDVVISTSKTETFCLVGIEALACGKRFCAYNLECLDTLFDDAEINLKSKSVEDFCFNFRLKLSKKYNLPNVEAFKQSHMYNLYAQIK